MAKSRHKFGSAGWGFWLIVFFIALGPCIYGLLQIGDKGVKPLVLVTFGALAAAIVAGLISWMVNALLQLRIAKIDAREVRERRKKRKKR